RRIIDIVAGIFGREIAGGFFVHVYGALAGPSHGIERRVKSLGRTRLCTAAIGPANILCGSLSSRCLQHLTITGAALDCCWCIYLLKAGGRTCRHISIVAKNAASHSSAPKPSSSMRQRR